MVHPTWCNDTLYTTHMYNMVEYILNSYCFPTIGKLIYIKLCLVYGCISHATVGLIFPISMSSENIAAACIAVPLERVPDVMLLLQ